MLQSGMIDSKLPLTVVILARNEEENIKACIESAFFADEILVIENNSSDRTVEFALEMKAKVLNRDLNNDYSAQRNFAIENSKHDWIFMLDADERITHELQKEIIAAVNSNEDFCYQVSRENHFVSGVVLHGDLRPDHVERLFLKNKSNYEGNVHERLHSSSPKKRLNGRLIHFPYKTWEIHMNKLNLYSSLVAEKYHSKGKKCNFVRDILIKPIWAFIKVYFIHMGFLDGKLGFIFSALHYFYTMEKFLKLDSLNGNSGKI